MTIAPANTPNRIVPANRQTIAARAAMAERELARRRMIHFVTKFRPRYLAGWVHQVICHKLERFSHAVAAEESPRLLIMMPPRHGKSALASEEFPAWHLGNFPNHEFIASSYNVSLPLGFSRKVKARLDDPAYKLIFPDCALQPDSQANEQWLTTEGGGYIAAGVGGGITGKGAHVLGIDDPIKKVVVMTKTSAKGLSVKDLFSAEDNAALSLVIQVLNPELSSDQRADFVNKFATTIKDDQSSFTTKIGTNRYFAGSAPDLGIWLVASVNSPKSEDKPTWAAKWRQRIGAWIKKERGGAPAQ